MDDHIVFVRLHKVVCIILGHPQRLGGQACAANATALCCVGVATGEALLARYPSSVLRVRDNSKKPPERSLAATQVVVRGAREHNLKGVDLTFPRDSLCTFTGVSGSGKSSLAYHTIYQEGQRRFLESLSSYARQFLGRMEKPKVDHVEGLSPTVSIDQKSHSHSVRSTVGTLTEVADFLRLLWSRLGIPSCPTCGSQIEAWSADRIVEAMLSDAVGQKAMVLAPVVRERKGEYRKELAEWRQKGFVRARIDGEVRRLDEDISLRRYVYHTIELVVDRLVLEVAERSRITEAVEQALVLGEGNCALIWGEQSYRAFSAARSCPNGHGSLPEMEPRLFSFNSPIGACQGCDGLGEVFGIEPELLVADPDKSVRDGALSVFTDAGKLVYSRLTLDHFEIVARTFGFRLDTPWRAMPAKAKQIVLYGSGTRTFEFRWQKQSAMFQTSGMDRIAFPGIVPHLESAYRPSRARHLDRFRASVSCPDCKGARLCAAARAVAFEGRALSTILALPVLQALTWVRGVSLRGNALQIGREILREIERRLTFLEDVGLGYLTLSRGARTLSGGELQRIRLAAQVGAGLRGILYVLDEPSIGLHSRDQERLLRTLIALRDRGNTVVVVEHDEATMRQSDFLVDIGPFAGREGGEVVSAGTPREVMADPRSLTGKYLRGELTVPVPERRRTGKLGVIAVRGAKHHNLVGIDVDFPLGRFVAITGVSGSGKSTLVHHVLKPALTEALGGAKSPVGRCISVTGCKQIDKVVEIDQSPIGRTPRSNPATYTEVWSQIRDLFALMPESLLRQYEKGRFSFNVKGGRCEACEGAGLQTLEMNFLAPVEVVCDQCGGARFHPETLEIRYKEHSVHDVLELTIDEALVLFANLPKIARALQTLADVGLGYLKLGQPSTTLSGGEAQRVKLATELQRPATGKTLYILDEPTTGLHFHDIARLLTCLQRLCDAGNTVLVIEHNLDVIRAADWLIDLGPEGGFGGGTVVACGTPEQLAKNMASHTGAALRAMLAPKQLDEVHTAAPRTVNRPTHITVRGARTNNLKNLDCDVPLDRFTVITGPSGSGKSSLAFDTLFQEGQRRFLESMSTYARRFLGRMDRAPVDVLDGLGPAIAIDQRQGARSPRSTVATTTEIHDYLRLLYARIGRPHCPLHGQELVAVSPSRMAVEVLEKWRGQRGYLLAPVFLPEQIKSDEDKAALWQEALRSDWQKQGFVRALRNGEEVRTDSEWPKNAPLELLVVIDRTSFLDRGRLVDGAEQALRVSAAHGGQGKVIVQVIGGDSSGQRLEFCATRSCAQCGFTALEQPHPRYFSFNHHSGACEACAGLGEVVICSEGLLVNHPDQPIFSGAIQHPGAAFSFLVRRDGYYSDVAAVVAERRGVDLSLPFCKLPKSARHWLLRGTGEERYEITFQKREAGKSRKWQMQVPWKGLARQVEEWFHGKDGENHGDDRLRAVMSVQRCPECDGERLRKAQRQVRVSGLRMPELCAQTVETAMASLQALKLSTKDQQIAQDVLKEISNRLSFLDSVGLGYLTLDRSAATLSGGESQRIRLATQLGNKLMGVLYVLDEPTVGLHARDTERLLRTLLELRDLGNTVVAVEHDEQVMHMADYVLDLGPGAGARGGTVVACGTPAEVAASDGLTGRYLRGELTVALPQARRTPLGHASLRGISIHNLRQLDVSIPLGCLFAVTGVSGSGKSSLVMDALVPVLRAGTADITWNDGQERICQLVVVDQSPLGSTPSSNPATYTGIFTHIRELFAKVEQSKAKGFGPGRFSFNVAEGRCATCEGKGQIQVEMHFLADVWVTCETCRGRRYNSETLLVSYRNKNIAQVLAMEVSDALQFFGNHPRIARPLQLLHDVGLGYLQLGQSANTFSGGEAQRLKLVAELAAAPREHMVYVLDEPTTGLHMDDVQKLLCVLQRLVERGDSVIVVEHHLDVIAAADVALEMGPEAGEQGGKIVAFGTPEEVARNSGSHTGRYLAPRLPAARKAAADALRPSVPQRKGKAALQRRARKRVADDA
ncbi:MAG: excinuclease ABC subunit UvrA [Planctomycetes bacterium]|nr:excinuclease ABC subunit UvrA [Planctomycetota bacterium]